MRTPLMVAASFDNVEAVEKLIDNEDEIDAIDEVSGTIHTHWIILVRNIEDMLKIHSVDGGDTTL